MKESVFKAKTTRARKELLDSLVIYDEQGNESFDDYLLHFTSFEEMKPAESTSSNKRQIACSSIGPDLYGERRSKNQLCSALHWGDSEIQQLLDGIFIRGVQVLLNEDLSKDEELHPLLSLFASDLFDQYCINGNQDPDYMRWGLACRLSEKPLNEGNAKIICVFLKLNP
jgi:hypothetical protein